MSVTSLTETDSSLRTYTTGGVHLDITAELTMARKILADTDQADIHDASAMIRAAVSLAIRLRALANAVEEGESR
ncbi:hypothetical protein ACWEOP_27405 [Streptomyces chartreusis]